MSRRRLGKIIIGLVYTYIGLVLFLTGANVGFMPAGTEGGTETIKQLLSYLKHSKIENVTNEKISHIHDYVKTVKQAAEVRDRYMTIGELMDVSKAEGIVLGRLEMIKNLMQSMDITAEKACELLKIDEVDYEAVKENLINL